MLNRRMHLWFDVNCGVDSFFFQAEDGIRDAQESRGLGDVYKRQHLIAPAGVSIGPLLSRNG